VYFLVGGSAAFVIQEKLDFPYIYIDPGMRWEKTGFKLVGYYFGEMDLMDNEEMEDKRVFTVKAIEDCEMLVIKKSVIIYFLNVKKDLYKIDIEFPDILHELLRNAKVRLRSAMNIKKNAEEFIRIQLSKSPKADNPQVNVSFIM
jgi:CRP-like cAMP-binding protein